MARKRITKERALLTLIEAKKSMDKGNFNSYSFRIQYPEWGQFACILKKNGVLKKQNQKYFWLSIEPNMNMVNKLLEIYYKKQAINRSTHLEKLSQKNSVIVEEQDLKSTSDLSFDYTEPKTTYPTLSFPISQDSVPEPKKNIEEVEDKESAEFDTLIEIDSDKKLIIAFQRALENVKSKNITQANHISKLSGAISDYKQKIDKQEKYISDLEKNKSASQETIAKQTEKLAEQLDYISDLEEIMENYKQDIDTLEKEFVELKKSINNQNNLYIKPNSKKIKFLGIPVYSVEY